MGVLSGAGTKEGEERRPRGREAGGGCPCGPMAANRFHVRADRPPGVAPQRGALAHLRLPVGAEATRGWRQPLTVQRGGPRAAGRLEWPGAVQHQLGRTEGPQPGAESARPRERLSGSTELPPPWLASPETPAFRFPIAYRHVLAEQQGPGVSAGEADHAGKLSARVCACPPAEGRR